MCSTEEFGCSGMNSSRQELASPPAVPPALCGVWQQHPVQAGNHLQRHMTPWLLYGQQSQAILLWAQLLVH